MKTNKRHLHYINPAIQKHLIIALVFIELLLISLTVFWLYLDMNQLIEDNMFKIHIQNTLSIEFFAVRLLQAAFILLIINIIFASLILWYWRNYIMHILTPLDEIATSIQNLDFTIVPDISVQHDTTQIAGQWLNHEKNKLTEIRQKISMINVDKPESTDDILLTCKRLLPPPVNGD